MNFKKPKFWDDQKLSFWSILLFPFSIIYFAITVIRRSISVLKRSKKISIPIICVGNIYIGGTGKTPLSREIFLIINSLGKKPAFIKKEYNYLSDEIKMLAETGKTFVSKNRLNSILLSANNNYDVAILDDGFQDLSIKPNFSILCFNSNQMFGNGLLIPSGPLREELSAISRADCVFINGNKNLELEKKIIKNAKTKKLHIFYSKYKIKNIEKFKDRNITAFAGIGNPSNFFDLLKKNNLNVENTFSFPDHHHYSEKDFEKIKKNNSSLIVTTEKDYSRLTNAQKETCDFVAVDLVIENKENFIKLIKTIL